VAALTVKEQWLVKQQRAPCWLSMGGIVKVRFSGAAVQCGTPGVGNHYEARSMPQFNKDPLKHTHVPSFVQLTAHSALSGGPKSLGRGAIKELGTVEH